MCIEKEKVEANGSGTTPSPDAPVISGTPEKSLEQWLEEAPYLREISQRQLLLEKKDFERYKRDPLIITVDNLVSWELQEQSQATSWEPKVKSQTVSAQLLADILTHDKFFNLLVALFKQKSNSTLRVGYVVYGDIASDGLEMAKSSVVTAINYLVASGKIRPSERVAELNALSSLEALRSDFSGLMYRSEIEGGEVEIPASQLIDLLVSNQNEYEKFLSAETYIGLSTEIVAFALLNFVRVNVIFESYRFEDEIVDRFLRLANYQDLDFQAINQYMRIDDLKISQVVVNESLHNAILENIPPDLSELEVAIYIYIKMCRILTYDPEYYAYDQKGAAAKKHDDVAKIVTVTPSNNRVVCFEFNSILGKMLEERGINFTTDSDLNKSTGYEGHAFLTFRVGKHIVKADSVANILGGDLLKAKLGQALDGLVCQNKNVQTRQEFQSSVDKVYAIVSKEKIDETAQYEAQRQSFHQALVEYRKMVAELRPSIAFGEQLKLMFEYLFNSGLQTIDAISYALLLRRILFTEEQKRMNISLSIVRENTDSSKESLATSTLIFALNDTDIHGSSENVYMAFSPPTTFRRLTRAEIVELFNSGTFQYVSDKDAQDHPIPGITVNN